MKPPQLVLNILLATGLCCIFGCGRQPARNAPAPAPPPTPRITLAELRVNLRTTQEDVGTLVTRISKEIENENIDAARTADEVERKIAEVQRLRAKIREYRATSKRATR